MTDDESRKKFEEMIGSQPYNLNALRYPDDWGLVWNNEYRNPTVRLVFDIWQEAVKWAWTHPPHEFICARCMLRQDNVHQSKRKF